MADLLKGDLEKEHYKLKVTSNKNDSKKSDDCCVGNYDDRMHLTNKWRLKK